MAYYKNGNCVFRYEELEAWGREICRVSGISEKEAGPLIEVLLLANLRGIDTHGITMLPSYAERYGNIEHREVRIEKDFGASVRLSLIIKQQDSDAFVSGLIQSLDGKVSVEKTEIDPMAWEE